jgi:hypothetical protein
MSVNEIDVNAVNKRTREKKVGDKGMYCCENGYTGDDHLCQKQDSATEQKVEYLSKLIQGSLRWRMHWYLLRFIMVLESIVWTLMDALRAWRMRVSARINANYQAKK